MNRTADVIVIGAGVNGASIAFHLARRGAGRVLVLEQGGPANGATGKSGALVRCHYTNQPETELAQRSLEYFHNWDGLVGGDCGFQQAGLLVFVPGGKEEALRNNIAMQQNVGVNTGLISAHEARELDPALQLDDVGGIAWEPGAGYADPHATTFGFCEAARRHGAEFEYGVRVTGLVADGSKITGVKTDRGQVSAGTVVVAAGAWASQLLDPLGLDDLGLIPTATSVAVFSWTPGRTGNHPTYIDHVHNTWMRRMEGNATLIGTEKGAVTNIEPDGYPEAPLQSYVELCRQKLVGRMPVMQHATMRGSWTGLIMRSEDSHPVIDRLDAYEGLYLMSGDNGSSFKTAPAIGLCMSELILDGSASTVDLRPFRSSRFRDGEPWIDSHRYTAANQTISR